MSTVHQLTVSDNYGLSDKDLENLGISPGARKGTDAYRTAVITGRCGVADCTFSACYCKTFNNQTEMIHNKQVDDIARGVMHEFAKYHAKKGFLQRSLEFIDLDQGETV